MQQHVSKHSGFDNSEPLLIEASPSQQSNMERSGSSTNEEINALKRSLRDCFKCSETVAEAFAYHLHDFDVPDGQDRIDWLTNMAWDFGIVEHGIDALNAALPNAVTTTPKLVKMKELCPPLRDQEADKEVHAWQFVDNGGAQSRTELKELCHIMFGKQLLFRGVSGDSYIDQHYNGNFYPTLGRFSFTASEDNEREFHFNEFGFGVYCTSDIKYAIQCSGNGPHSVVFVFDWNDTSNLVPCMITETEDWTPFVNQHICRGDRQKANMIGYPRRDLHLTYDYIQGKLTKNYRKIKSCHEPIPSEITQVAIIRDYNEILYTSLKAVIYITKP